MIELSKYAHLSVGEEDNNNNGDGQRISDSHYKDEDDDALDDEYGVVSTNSMQSDFQIDLRAKRRKQAMVRCSVLGFVMLLAVTAIMKFGGEGDPSKTKSCSGKSNDLQIPGSSNSKANNPVTTGGGKGDSGKGVWYEDPKASSNNNEKTPEVEPPQVVPPSPDDDAAVDIKPDKGITSKAQDELNQQETNYEDSQSNPDNEDDDALEVGQEEEEIEEQMDSIKGVWIEDEDQKAPASSEAFLPPTLAPSDGNNEGAIDENLPTTSEPTEPAQPSEEEGLSESGEYVDAEDSHSAEEDSAAAAKITNPQFVQYQYRSRRGKPLPDEDKQELAKKWGEWTFQDLKADLRPTEDYCGAYPSRDIPWEEFPHNAWQTDTGYLQAFLPQARDLVERAMEAHLAEYGFGPDDLSGEDFESRRDMSPFKLEILDHYSDDPKTRRKLSTGVDGYSGWMTQQSFDGLVRRLLHAIVSRDSFTLLTGGHSAAAGHGNHFQQSYTLQFQRVMEPVFARLGVKHFARNMGMGGLGTIQSVMGARDIYGRDVDILVWDSAMTEPADSPDFDLFARQGILGSDRAPVLWAGKDDKKIYPALQEHADVDYMMYGTGLGPIPPVTDPTTVDQIPWAARYLKCENEWHRLCNDNKFNGTCWIERPDHFVPPTPQNAALGGRAQWHDGNRMHQLYGRTMSFTVLRALQEAIEVWGRQPDHKLTDEMWHMGAYYENIRNKVANLDPEIGTCHQITEKRMSTDFCKIPFQARTEFTPRANPANTSLRSIMKPFGLGPDKSLPQPEENIYDPPDMYNPVLGVPDGEVDYLAIVENGIDYLPFDAPGPPLRDIEVSNRLIKLAVDGEGEEIVPGLGWGVTTKSSPDLCNGTYDSFCGRSKDQECLLYAHNDFRGGITFDSFSGWGIFTLKNLKEGLIYLKMDSWRQDNAATEGWTAENNGTRSRSLSNEGHVDNYKDENWFFHRSLANEFCDDQTLEFAFGDTVIRLTSDEILAPERFSLIQRVVQIWTVLEDRDYTKGDTVDVELGLRLRGCQREHAFWLTHIYWA